MPTAQATVSIPTPARYMRRLCKHFAHRLSVHEEDGRARIDFPDAPCTLVATDTHLELRLEASDAATLERLEQVVTRHLKQVASAEVFEVSWTQGHTAA